jgi:hypothetical protein
MSRLGEERSLEGQDVANAYAGRAFRPADSVRTATMDGRTTVLDLDHERYFGLDDVGTAIWELVRQQHTFEQIVEQLGKDYEAPRSDLERDVIGFLTELRTRQLVVDA